MLEQPGQGAEELHHRRAAERHLDAELVHDITEALWRPGNRALLDGGHPMGLHIRLDAALDDLTVPLHDGARRYYTEQKLIN